MQERERPEGQLDDVVEALEAVARTEPHPELAEPTRGQPVAGRQPDVLRVEPVLDLARLAHGRPGSARSSAGWRLISRR